MSKAAEGMPKEPGVLIVSFEPFQGGYLPIGTECIIQADLEDRYRVVFPGQVGYAGNFSIKKSYVSKS